MSITIWVEADESVELNMANTNAYAILGAIDIQGDGGHLSREEVAIAAVKTMRLLNSEGAKWLEVETMQKRNMILCGRDREYVTDRLTRLLEIFTTAQQMKSRVLYG